MNKIQGARGVCSAFCDFLRFLAPRGVCFDGRVYSVLKGSEEWYIFVLEQVHTCRDFLSCHIFGACLFFTLLRLLRVTFVTDSRMSKIYFEVVRIASGGNNGKYIALGLGLNGAEIKRGREDHHREYLQHNTESTRHRYSPESISKPRAEKP